MTLSHVQSHVHSPLQFETTHLVTARATHLKSQPPSKHFHNEPSCPRICFRGTKPFQGKKWLA